MSLIIFVFFIHLLFCRPATTQPFTVYYDCLHDGTLSSSFQQNLKLALANLENLSSSGVKYNITHTGSGIDEAYALIQCRGDQSLQDCAYCVSNATTVLQNDCPSFIGARIQLDHCYLRYDNKTFFTPDFTQVSEYCFAPISNTSVALESLMENVTNVAPKHGGYAAESAGGLYALVQCLGYLNESECSQCLASFKSRRRCNSDMGVPGEQWHSVSCYYRYESYSFFTPTPSGATPPARSPASTTHKTEGGILYCQFFDRKKLESPFPLSLWVASSPELDGTHERWKIVIIIVGAVVGAVFAIVSLYLTLVRRLKAKTRQDLQAQNDAGTQPFFERKAKVFSLHELEVATRDFNPANKLGQGGFGSVYKGTLSNGQHVAVKKLSSQSQQGMLEFMNEVNLITSVQHKNLIKLLGCCVEGHERILVYEYLPNGTVNAVLFGDSMDGRTLDWPTRYGIILGTARGLSYLHEESQVRIIHRDIKPSNILLDDQFNPIIADFGLARLFSDEESHTNTTVAGTLGYLAPEYVAHGQLTEKADVFSFGVVTLEVISGRKTTDVRLLTQNGTLLEWTWRLYREQRQLELVDPKLGDSCINCDQFIRVVHVALLCIQENATLRPTMSTVTLLLSGKSDMLKIPTKPAFVGLSDLRAPVDSTNRARTSTSTHSSIMSAVEPR